MRLKDGIMFNETIKSVIIYIIVFIYLVYGANLLGRAFVYQDQEKNTRFNICLNQELGFKECHEMIYGK